MLKYRMVKVILQKRPLDSNKGTFGKVMLLCGSPPYPGSAFLAGSAAGRAGAALMTLAGTEESEPIYARAVHQGPPCAPPAYTFQGFQRVHMPIRHPARSR